MIAQQPCQPGERLGIAADPRILQRLAPRHLLHEKCPGHRGVRLGLQQHPVQLAEVGSPSPRFEQRAVGLVGPSRKLHRDPALGCTGRSEAVRMHRSLQPAIGLLELGGVDPEPLGQSEQLEMTLGQDVHRIRERLKTEGGRGPPPGSIRASFRP